MNTTERINAKRGEILAEMEEADRRAYRHNSCEYRVYIDTDGAIDAEEWLANDNGRFVISDPSYSREYIRTFCHQFYSALWDYWFTDSQDFSDAFREEFGFDLSAEYEDESMETQAELTLADQGIDKKRLADWLDKQEEMAIDSLVSDTEYGEILDEAIQEIEEAENW